VARRSVTLAQVTDGVSQPPTFRSLLYREPRLYDLVLPDGDGITRMLRTAIGPYLLAAPRSMLDVACGTGRLLGALAGTIPECHGVDLLTSNIAYARSVRAGITFHVRDMRTVRLGRTFDVVTCLGNTLSCALTDRDLTDTVRTFAAHAREGTLLVDPLNARAYLNGEGFETRIEGRVDTPATVAGISHADRRRPTAPPQEVGVGKDVGAQGRQGAKDVRGKGRQGA
jgi:SAM-dependent methyltransferase